MASRDGRRTKSLCKFQLGWTFLSEFSSWLAPVKGDKHRAYCLVCRKIFSIGHGGMNDVRTHYKGKKHILLQREQEAFGLESDKRKVLSAVPDLRFIFDDDTVKLTSLPPLHEPEEAGLSEQGVCHRSNSPDQAEFRNASVDEVKFAEQDLGMEPEAMSAPQQYCLRWKYHHNNLQVMFTQLLERESFCDVTLACEGRTLRAHKVVLSACSTYFDSVFTQYEEKNPIVILKDVKFDDIKALVEFMYKGEINIEQSHLASLLKTAEDLKIKGLAEVSWRADESSNRQEAEHTNSDHSQDSTVRNGTDGEPPYKRKRGRPNLDDSAARFSPKVMNVSGAVGTENAFTEEPGKADAPLDTNQNESENDSEVIPMMDSIGEDSIQSNSSSKGVTSDGGNQPTQNIAQLAEQYGGVIKLNDYLATGRRQQFWEEPFTKRIMEAIKHKELEMKAGAELLGVSYGTLYGRYRDAYGCLKHPYRLRDFWSEPGPSEVLQKLQRKEMTLFKAAELLNVTVTTLANYLSTYRKSGEGFIGHRFADDSRDEFSLQEDMSDMMASEKESVKSYDSSRAETSMNKRIKQEQDLGSGDLDVEEHFDSVVEDEPLQAEATTKGEGGE